MKKLLFLCCIGASLASCKKEPVQQQSMLTLSAVAIDTLIEPGDTKLVATVGILFEGAGIQQIPFTFTMNTVGNIYATNVQASIVDDQGNQQGLGSIPGEVPRVFSTPTLEIHPGVRYKLSISIDTEPSDMGTIQFQVNAPTAQPVTLPTVRFGVPAPTIEYMPVEGTITIGDPQIRYKHRETVPRGTTMYQTQLTYAVRFQSVDTALGFVAMRLLKNGEDITNRVSFFDEQDTGKVTVFRRSMTMLRAVFSAGGAEDTLRGVTTYELETVALTNNSFAVQLLSDGSWNPAHVYRTGSLSAKLASSPTASTGTRYNFIYSYGGPNHSSVVPFSTSDHRSGYGVFTTLPQRVWTQ